MSLTYYIFTCIYCIKFLAANKDVMQSQLVNSKFIQKPRTQKSTSTYNEITQHCFYISSSLVSERFDAYVYILNKTCKIIICVGTEQQNPDTNKLILCPYCDFAFCPSCKSSYHGVSPCKDFADKRKKSLSFLYGKQFLTQQLTEFMSRLWLKEKSKQCPNCYFSIEKIDGCNKIHCFRCNSNFCWLCLSKLRSDFPYLHFRDTKSPCYAKLFIGVIQDEIEDGDDEEWEEIYIQ
uniref:RBR-type E3 ubiquitin transferase n=1 Tax=Tetranychus urticae TaxID=32264 RepID=T1L539_TETUR